MVQFDGNPFEMWTVGVAATSCVIRPIRRHVKKSKVPCWVFRDIVLDFLNGTVIVPLLILVGSIFSRELLEEAVKTDKVFFAIAGIVALLFVLREYGNGD